MDNENTKQPVKTTLLALSLSILLSGCINMYTRFPTTEPFIADTYQSTEVSVAPAPVVTFPQVMNGWSPRIEPENLFTIPFGLLVLCDTALEASVDTLCWPWDKYISNKRERERGNGQNADGVEIIEVDE